MHTFLTSVYEEGDVRSALLSAIQALYYAKNGIDIISQTPVILLATLHLPYKCTATLDMKIYLK